MALIGIRLGSLSCSPLFRPVRAAPVFASATSRHFAFPWLLFRDCGRFSPRPFLPSSSFHPRKIPPSLFLCLPISISIPLFPSKPYNRLHGITYRCSSEPRTPFALTHARIPNECYNPRSLYDPFSLSLSRPLIFCPLILALWDSVISHRGGLLSAAGIDATKKCATASIADSETRFRRRSNGIARGDSFIVVQQHVVHNTRCNALFFLFLSGYCLYCAVNVDGIGRWDPAGNF